MFPLNMEVSCNFSLQPINWNMASWKIYHKWSIFPLHSSTPCLITMVYSVIYLSLSLISLLLQNLTWTSLSLSNHRASSGVPFLSQFYPYFPLVIPWKAWWIFPVIYVDVSQRVNFHFPMIFPMVFPVFLCFSYGFRMQIPKKPPLWNAALRKAPMTPMMATFSTSARAELSLQNLLYRLLPTHTYSVYIHIYIYLYIYTIYIYIQYLYLYIYV